MGWEEKPLGLKQCIVYIKKMNAETFFPFQRETSVLQLLGILFAYRWNKTLVLTQNTCTVGGQDKKGSKKNMTISDPWRYHCGPLPNSLVPPPNCTAFYLICAQHTSRFPCLPLGAPSLLCLPHSSPFRKWFSKNSSSPPSIHLFSSGCFNTESAKA